MHVDIHRHENKQNVHGTAPMKAKDCLTAFAALGKYLAISSILLFDKYVNDLGKEIHYARNICNKVRNFYIVLDHYGFSLVGFSGSIDITSLKKLMTVPNVTLLLP